MSKINNLHYYFHNIKVTVDCPHKKTRNFLENSFFFLKKLKSINFVYLLKLILITKKVLMNLAKKE